MIPNLPSPIMISRNNPPRPPHLPIFSSLILPSFLDMCQHIVRIGQTLCLFLHSHVILKSIYHHIIFVVVEHV